MSKCFLSYSSEYSHLKEPFRRLLQVLGFEVDVFDEPNSDRPPKPIIQERIKNADAIVVLYGPDRGIVDEKQAIEGSFWPQYEAAFAYDLKKPLALLTHPRVKLPLILEDYQTCPHFDFWNPQSFLDNIHYIVKHLLDLKRRVDLPPGSQPYYFKNIVYRYRISNSRAMTMLSVYNDVVARQACSKFFHRVNTGEDTTEKVRFGKDGLESYDVEAVPSSDYHRVSISKIHSNDYDLEYSVNIDPPLIAGERFGYRRTFTMPNRFPLTYTELLSRSQEEGYPSTYPYGFYGDYIETPYEVEQVTFAIHFPIRVKLDEIRVLVTHSLTHEENKEETERCRPFLKLKEEAGDFERILEFQVRSPVLSHNYYMLYKPGN